ncbi:hypothetical protein EYM_01650 [Ignicoccus islandicus DSM 13165]|uniref:Cytochrome c-type biogenesis protein CcmE n=1 Tax=Ignicoccus islandicus DSM 13165 TaxID=940295 RepID=A0A0U3F5Z4_9CREN|nr:hypothetical protein [Ignicoccus islandicus]ALU11496.1 hypothetical protein EYM_01650 [Ignicoccus islandicus DSM 13165]
MKKDNKRFLLLSVSLFALFGAIGIYATSSSSYVDVSDLIHKKPGVYMVRGDVVRWTVQGSDLVLILEGKKGDKITARVPVSYIEKKYGPLNQVVITKGEMVVKGYWDGNVLRISDILKGCHSAYQQPTVST